jgi:hypothetical protein
MSFMIHVAGKEIEIQNFALLQCAIEFRFRLSIEFLFKRRRASMLERI